MSLKDLKAVTLLQSLKNIFYKNKKNSGIARNLKKNLAKFLYQKSYRAKCRKFT